MTWRGNAVAEQGDSGNVHVQMELEQLKGALAGMGDHISEMGQLRASVGGAQLKLNALEEHKA